MLIRYFRSGFPGRFVTIGVTGLILWGTGAVTRPLMPPPDGPVPLYSLLYGWLSDFPYMAIATGFILVALEAVWFNHILSKHGLVSHNSSLAALLFLLFISSYPSYQTLTPVNISLVFLLLILRAIFEAYHTQEPIELVYTSGFFIAVASLFYFPVLLVYGFLLICFLVYRTLKWREWVSSLIGLATPFIFLTAIYFLMDRLPDLVQDYVTCFGQYSLVFPVFSLPNQIVAGLCGWFLLTGLWDRFRHLPEMVVEIRKKTVVLLWLFLFILLSAFYANPLLLYHPGLAAICLAAFTAPFFLHLRKPFRYEWLIWVLILAIFGNTLANILR